MKIDVENDSDMEIASRLKKCNPFHLRRLYTILFKMRKERYFRFKPPKENKR